MKVIEYLISVLYKLILIFYCNHKGFDIKVLISVLGGGGGGIGWQLGVRDVEK